MRMTALGWMLTMHKITVNKGFRDFLTAASHPVKLLCVETNRYYRAQALSDDSCLTSVCLSRILGLGRLKLAQR